MPWTQYILRFMEANPDVPKEYYGRWWKIINEEFGEIVPDEEENEKSRDQQESCSNYIESNMVQVRKDDSVQEKNKSLEQAQRPNTGTFRNKDTETGEYSHQKANQSEVGQKLYQLTKEEEENLSAYLGLGMSLNEARDQFKKEIEVAEMRQRIRDNTRLQNRGSVGAAHRTQIGPSTSTRGTGRGGLSFN